MQRQIRVLNGLVAAPHTPMNPDGSVNLGAIPAQADGLLANGASAAFICGSTGEGHSLTLDERRNIATAWHRAIAGRPLKLVVHVGHNCVEDAVDLAEHAAGIEADAISAMAPSYFKPGSVEALIQVCAPIAAAAPELPFYYYEIPAMTGVALPMHKFLQQGGTGIPNLAGLKFSSNDLMGLQQCLAVQNGRFNILFGSDEILLAALALGVHGAVGSTYNYAAPLYRGILTAFESGDLATARALQLKSVRLVEILAQYGVLAAGKALMGLVGVECGPVRPPNRPLSASEIASLRQRVSALDVLSKGCASPVAAV